jgi:hypothetical protein
MSYCAGPTIRGVMGNAPNRGRAEGLMVSAQESLVNAVRLAFGSRRRPGHAICPMCGTLFDAPRVNPLTGSLARKCDVCQEWHPLNGSAPYRGE